ncbi:hypothetical protein ACJJTC_004980, partial [Scirpophaga incertulas]
METDSAPPPPSDVAPGRQPSPPPQPFTPPSEKEELMREMMLRIGGLINARFEGLEGRLLPAPNLRPGTEMLEGVDSDIWGRPYRMVRNKLRAVAAPLTESLQPELLDRVVSALFPARPRGLRSAPDGGRRICRRLVQSRPLRT